VSLHGNVLSKQKEKPQLTKDFFASLEPYLHRLQPPILFLHFSSFFEDSVAVKRIRSSTEAQNLFQLWNHCPRGHCVYPIYASDSVLAMSACSPFTSKIKTFRDFLNFYHTCPWPHQSLKSILVQCIVLLRELQNGNTHFSHNDFKADNIMLERCHSSYLYIGKFIVAAWSVKVVFIDAETVSGCFYKPSPLLSKLSRSSKASFGLDFPFSPFTDIHLVFMEILCAMKEGLKIEGFLEFLDSDGIPTDYFQQPYITKENRLSGIGRVALKQSGRTLESMLKSKYLCSHLRA
jgi:hypothetical protein